jgi:hypothetical protein
MRVNLKVHPPWHSCWAFGRAGLPHDRWGGDTWWAQCPDWVHGTLLVAVVWGTGLVNAQMLPASPAPMQPLLSLHGPPQSCPRDLGLGRLHLPVILQRESHPLALDRHFQQRACGDQAMGVFLERAETAILMVQNGTPMLWRGRWPGHLSHKHGQRHWLQLTYLRWGMCQAQLVSWQDCPPPPRRSTQCPRFLQPRPWELWVRCLLQPCHYQL